MEVIMGKTGAVKHTHQYFRRDDGMWACSGIDECSHYMPKNMLPLPVGRKSICWGCEREFQLTPYAMRNAKPMCDECEDKTEVLGDFIEERMKSVKPLTGLAAFGAKPRV
jgi:hypothetical protein